MLSLKAVFYPDYLISDIQNSLAEFQSWVVLIMLNSLCSRAGESRLFLWYMLKSCVRTEWAEHCASKKIKHWCNQGVESLLNNSGLDLVDVGRALYSKQRIKLCLLLLPLELKARGTTLIAEANKGNTQSKRASWFYSYIHIASMHLQRGFTHVHLHLF